MTDLYEPSRHTACIGAPWDADLARDAIREIVSDTLANRRRDGSWAPHPLDLDGDKPPRHGWFSTYLGGAGTVWALWYLSRHGAASCDIDLRDAIDGCARDYLRWPDTGEVAPSYFLGSSGIDLVRWMISGTESAERELEEAVRANIDNPTNEMLWAAPGSMLAALGMWESTEVSDWKGLVQDSARYIISQLRPSEHGPYSMWTQDMYGHRVQHIGAGHGFAGNMYALMRCAEVLSSEQLEWLESICFETLTRTRRGLGGLANWPQSIGPPRPGRTAMLVQWCHGAPGVITCMAPLATGRNVRFDAMMVAAGEMVWRAGPLAKGYGLCHGTAGNGMALLALHRRTGDSLWLERARAFAMHAIKQRRDDRASYGQGRYSLWLGDPGLAYFLWHCIAGSSGMPLLGVFK